MNVSDLTIDALKDLITGDTGNTPYASGPNIIKFFNSFGINDEYSYQAGGLPGAMSRPEYAYETLKKLNNSYEFKALIESLADFRKVDNPDEIADFINQLIKYDGYKLEKDENDIYKVLGGQITDPVQLEAHFNEIKKHIAERLLKANFSIWVAMAWFTEKNLGNLLREKHQAGVNVQVIVNDDEITKEHGLKFNTKGIEYYEVAPNSPWGKKIMHNKFCIIDLQTVIHGSYNWTGNAKYNNEAITIVESRENAEEFAKEFIKLKTET